MPSDFDRDDPTIWKRIARLFKSGPVVRHKIAGGEKLNAPQGSASAFKKDLSSLYVRALASYANHERLSRYSDYAEMELCLSAGTLIAVPGGFKTIEELSIEYGDDKPFIIYAYDHIKHRIVPAWGKQARKTRTDHSWKVIFDNGKEIVGTDDHRLMLRDGSYRIIGDLKPGDSMMPFKRRSILADNKHDPDEYQFIYLGYDPTWNGGWASEHKMIASFVADRQLTGDEVVHHVNFKKADNRPENLWIMSDLEHRQLHAKINNEKKWNYETNADWIEKFKVQHSKFMTENNPATRHDVTFEKILDAADKIGYDCGKVGKALGTGFEVIIRRLQSKGFENWTQFATAYCPNWKNSSHDNAGTKNPMYDRSITFEMICNAFKKGMGVNELVAACNTPRSKVWKRVVQAGFKNLKDFCKNYENCKVVSVEYHGIIDLYDLTVDGYKNFATDSVISHNTPELHSALDIYSDETCVPGEDGRVVEITSRNEEIKQTLEELFFDVLNIDFNAWSWVRHLCKFGDFCMMIDANEENGILNLFPIPINEIEREEGFDPKDPMAVRYRWLTRGNMILQNWQIIHFRLLGNDAYLPYGCSILEPARRIWRQLILIEDAMLVYRIVRSPERRVFHIEVGAIPPEQVEPFIEQVKTQMKRSTIVDPDTGRVDLRYNPLSVEEDYWLPKRGEIGSRIDTLAGGQFPVRANTPVPLLDGRVLTIEQVAAEFDAGKENWVHSLQEGTNTFVPGKIIWCGKNYRCDSIRRIWFDDGTYADMAPEHPVMLRDGSKLRADALSVGVSVMPFTTSTQMLGKHDYRSIRDPADDEWKIIHRQVKGPQGISEAIARSGEKNFALHHVDFNRFNNNPDNLLWMGRLEHVALHGANAKKNLHTPEMDAKNRLRISEYNRSATGRAQTVERNSKRWLDQKFRDGHSGKNHWLAKKWNALYDKLPPEKLAKFCLDRGIKSLTMLGETVDRPLRTIGQFRHCLQHHGIKNWTQFAQDFLDVRPRNHIVVRVETLTEADDVYCMTVVGPDGQDDRHNFALLTRLADGSVPDTWNGIFVSNTGDIEDVQYIQGKLFAAIKIPRAYLGYEENLGSKATLCLRGDTQVFTLNGQMTISEIEKRFNDGSMIWIMSCDSNGSPRPAPVVKAWKTKQVHELVRVTLDDGSIIESTATHPFLMRDGSYKNAGTLVDGDSLMPGYSRLSDKATGDMLDGYEMIFDNSLQEWRYTHRIVDDCGHVKSTIEKARVIHHIDCDKLNNDPTNLTEMTWFSHRRWHQQNAHLTLMRPDVIAKREPKLRAWRSSEKNKEQWCEIGKRTSAPGTKFYEMIHSETFSQECSERMRNNWQVPEYRALKSKQNADVWNNPITRAKLSGENHWCTKRKKIYDLGWLIEFCKKNEIYEKKQLFAHPEMPIGDRHYRDILKTAGFRDFRQFSRAHLVNNHKVVRVETINLEQPEWVYDLEVGSCGPNGSAHNFLLGVGIYVHNSQEDIRFSKTIERIQRLFVFELNKIAIVHLFLLGYSGRDLVNFEIQMASPSTVAQQQRLELWRMKLEVAGMAQEGVFDRGTMYKRIFGLNDKEVAKIKEGKRIDKLEDALLESIQAPDIAGAGAGPGPGGGGPPTDAGAEELPTTLGGPPGGGAGPPPEAGGGEGPLGPPVTSGLDRGGAVVSEKFNRGSKDFDSGISVVKGKDLFAPGENLLNHTFGTEKQTASDPNDRRSRRRTVTRPFSEAGTPEIDDDASVDDVDDALAAIGRWLDANRPK